MTYYSQVLEVIAELNPIIVFLYRPDLRNSLEKAFKARGKWWRDLILRKDDLHIYFKSHIYISENSMFDAIDYEQVKMMEIFDQLKCLKIKIDTSEEQWDLYVQEITREVQIVPIVTHPHWLEEACLSMSSGCHLSRRSINANT